MKEYTLEDIEISEVIEEAKGFWDGEYLKRFNVNYSSILTHMIKTAGLICEQYASDLFIDWQDIYDELYNPDYEGGKYLFGFRESGIDNNTFVLVRLNAWGKESLSETYSELLILDIAVENKTVMHMTLGKVKINDNQLYKFNKWN